MTREERRESRAKCRIVHVAASRRDRGKELHRCAERDDPSRRRSVRVPSAVVRFHREDPATRSRDAGALTYRCIDVADVLQHGNAERRVEHTVSKRQAAGVGRRESDPLVVRSGLLLRELHAIKQQIDTDQTNLRDMKTPDAYLGSALPAADIENPITRPRSQGLREKLGELVVPPPRAEVLQCR